MTLAARIFRHLATFSTGCLTLSLLAQTPDAPPQPGGAGSGNRGGFRGRGGGGLGGFGGLDLNATLATQIIGQGDQDGDKKISKAELAALAAVWFEKLDPDKTGKVNPDDFAQRFRELLATGNQNATPANPPNAAPGAPDRARGRAGGGRGGRGGGLGGGFNAFANPSLGLFLAADVDKDGTLTRDELKTSLGHWFDKWDAEKSGALEEEKVRAGLTSTLPQPNFGGRGGRGGRGGFPGGGLPGNAPEAPAEPTGDFSAKPPIVPAPPEEELKKFLLPPGYRLDLALSDPDIEEPMAMVFDGNGRMFVLEMRTYMQDADAGGELAPTSRISMHEDTDGDGKYERHTVFIDKMVVPRFVLPLDGHSVLSMESNVDEVFKYTDTDGDGVADRKELFATGFGRGGNIEHQQSSLFWAMDNWLYSTVNAFRVRLTPEGKVARESTGSNGAQWGVTQDNYGKVYFQGGASGVPSYFQLPIVYGNFTVSDQLEPGFTVPHGAAGVGDFQPGANASRPDGTLNQVTGSAGNDVYRGDRLPADLVGDYFYGEPVARIVRRVKVETTDGLTRMRNAYQKEQSEFIRSTDHLFRPVEMETAPDGTLYIVDAYRGIIQEGNWTRPGSYLRRKIDQYQLDKVHSHGRIWRLTYDGIERDRRRPRMLDEAPAELVKHLEHPNGWWRDQAQKLLVLRRDKSVVPTLQSMARSSASEFGRIHALWTLEGLGALDASLVRDFMKDANPRLRVQAIRASESLFKAGDKSFESDVRALATDSDPNVAIQSLLTLNLEKVPNVEAFVRSTISSTNSNRGVREIGAQILQPRGGRGGFGPGGFGGPFTATQRSVMQRGAVIYQELCFACHGVDGKGTPVPDGLEGATQAPSMAGSPRIQGHRDYVINVVLHGLEGPVDGKTYPAEMVPMGSNKDEWIADIASYVRNSFGNSASFVTPEQVAKVRAAGGSRSARWNIDELVASVPRVLRYQPDWKVTASHNADMAGYAINSSGMIRWDTGAPQQPGMWFQIEMPKPASIAEIQLDSPGGGGPFASNAGFPREYEVRISTDGKDWGAPIAMGKGDGPTTVIAFGPVQAKFIRVTQTGSAPNAPAWSIQKTKLFQAGQRSATMPRAAARNRFD